MIDVVTKKSEYTIRDGILAVWKLSFPHRRMMSLLALLGIFSALASALAPYLSGRFFDALNTVAKLGGEHTFTPVYMALGVWFVVQFIQNIIGWFQTYYSRGLPQDIEFTVYQSAVAHLLRMPLSYHKEHHLSEIREVYNRATSRTAAIITNSISLLGDFLSVIFGILIAFTLNVPMTFVLVFTAGLYTFIMVRSVSISAGIQLTANKLYQKAHGRASNTVSQVDIVKISTSEDFEDIKRDADLTDARESWHGLEKIWARLDSFQRIMISVVQGTIFLLSVEFVARGEISLGTLVAFNGYAMMFLAPIVRIGMQWQMVQNGLVAADTLYKEILDHETEIYTPQDALFLGEVKGEVVFDEVSFHYAKGETEILDKVTFLVKAGETVAFVGESGVGKSTTISLISALYFPTSGSVKIDGIDTRRLDLKELRSNIAIVPQELSLFNDTIEANIKYGSFNATHDEVVRAAEIAQCDQFIEKMPYGYETMVGERGVKLSVGQKQRVAIARAVLRDPAILILDEPTSALDPKTEKELTESLEELMEGRTTFIVAHRLSTVRKADKIIVIEEGKIIEMGSHEELLKKENGKYRKMYEHNSGLNGK